MSKIYQTTDELWEAVINNLPEEIKANVSAFADKSYIHIKPKSKHLGVKDFKYCVEYSKTKERAYVNVETLNGGVEGKTVIQNYIDSNSVDCIVKSVVPQQGVKNKDKWKWEVTTPATELNEELAQWYVQTIVAFWNFFEGESEVEENAENSSGKERLTLKQYILNLVYIFDEFDMDDCDGSYYTKFGKLGEFDLFDEEQIDDVLSDNYIYDGELSKDSFCDEVSEDDLYCVISNLVDNLDQGSIKSMQIKDGSKVIFEVSNDEPFVD